MSDESGLPEQTPEERREIALRYRKARTKELHDIAAAGMERPPVAVGEFTASRFEFLAAVPFVGPFLALGAKINERRKGIPGNVLLALDEQTFNVLEIPDVTTLMIERPTLTAGRDEGSGQNPVDAKPKIRLVSSTPRDSVRVTELVLTGPKHRVSFDRGPGSEPLTLYTSSLSTNPWSRELLTLLGAEGIPAPIDPTSVNPMSTGSW